MEPLPYFDRTSLEIAMLDITMEAAGLAAPLWIYNQRANYHDTPGSMVGFYTYDTRFDGLFDHPERLLAYHPSVIIEPNFSITETNHYPMALIQIYKKRELARYYQWKGIRVYVDLFVPLALFPHLALHGVPPGWRHYATRGQAAYATDLAIIYEYACHHAGGAPLTQQEFLVYGGGHLCHTWASQTGVTYLSNFMPRQRLSRQPVTVNGVTFHAYVMEEDVVNG